MDFSFLGNTLWQWAIALGVTIGAAGAMYGLHTKLQRRLDALARRTMTKFDEVLAAIVTSTYLLFIIAVALYVGSNFLNLSPRHELFVTRIAITALLVQAALWGDAGMRAWRAHFQTGPDGGRRASTAVLCFVGRLALWVILSLLILENLGFNITTLVASLGIGGVAVALAVQNILGDLFASLSIMLDKPFEVGDFIIVGDVLGTVEHIGLKTTRVRGLGGEQVVFSNGDLLKSRIHNHRRLQRRRVAFILRIAYGTPGQQLAAIPDIIRSIVTQHKEAEFEHTHLMGYGEWSLDFEMVYYYGSPDFFPHLDLQQKILLDIYRRFEQEGIRFAHRLSIVRIIEDSYGGAGPQLAPLRDTASRADSDVARSSQTRPTWMP